MSVYLGDWKDAGFDGLVRDYSIKPQELALFEVLVAGYFYGSYEGSSFVLLRHIPSGILYESHGSHCSCYGLEDQLFPLEETSAESLAHRLEKGEYFNYLAEEEEREQLRAAIREAIS